MGHLVRTDGQVAPKAIFAPSYGKARLAAVPEQLLYFNSGEVFKRSVAELEVPTSEERRERTEKFLEGFAERAGQG